VFPPRYSYLAMNALSLNDGGRFLYLDSWGVGACLSILAHESALENWTNGQYPLSQAEIDDLENKLATLMGGIMASIVGLITPIATAAVPRGMLLCDGSTYLRADYPNLYAAIAAPFIIDADSFVVPDMRDRFVMGAGPSHTVADTGGNFSITQTIAQMPIHSHSSAPHSHSEVIAAPTAILIGAGVPAPSAIPAIGATGLTSVSISNEGGGGNMDVTNPYIALRFAIIAL